MPQHDTDCHSRSLVRHSPLPCELPSPVVHPRDPPRRTTMSLPGSTTKTSAATTRLTASAPVGQGSSAAPACLDSAPTSPVGTLALRAISGSGPGRSRGHRSSSPIPPTMPPPAHMPALAHLWTKMYPDLQTQLSQISVSDLRAGLDHAEATTTRDTEATATRHASKLAEEEHQQALQHLLTAENDNAHSLAAARVAYEARKADTQDCAIVVGSRVQAHERAKAAVLHSSRNHEFQLADLNNQPRQPPPPTWAHPTMAPPPPRPSSSVAVAWIERRTRPDAGATVASGTYRAPQSTMFVDSYLDVRVSAFRHRIEELPRAVRDQIYDLPLAVFSALRPTRQTKAPLRLARDLVSSQWSLFRSEIIDDVLALCDAVRQAYNMPAALVPNDTPATSSVSEMITPPPNGFLGQRLFGWPQQATAKG